MLNRRRLLQSGLAGVGSLSLAPSLPAFAQGKAMAKVRYSEVVRAMLYAPTYVAMTQGMFKQAGLDVALSTAQGGDKSVAALLAGAADIALIGPETTIYVQNSNSPTKIPIFCALTATDGFMIVSRTKFDKPDWSVLKGKEFLGFRPGSTPLLFLEAALRKNGINPKEVKLNNNVAIPARLGSWLAGQNEFAIFQEPECSQLFNDGKAHYFASIGQIVGPADYTTFMATDKYISNNPQVVQAWTNAIYAAQKWTAEQPDEKVAEALAPFFVGISLPILTIGVKRYRDFKIWKTTPKVDESSFERFQDILIEGSVLEKDKRVKFETAVRTEFANKAS